MTMHLAQATLKNYQATPTSLWQGRSDGQGAERYHECIKCLDLSQEAPPLAIKTTFALLGFACDEGVRRNQGRVGAAYGPAALRASLAPFPMAGDIVLYDAGDIVCHNGDLEGAQKALGEVVAGLLHKKICPIVLGGGHELAWGTYLGQAAACEPVDCAFVNCDAHLDLRPQLAGDRGSSGTSFAQIASHRLANNMKFDYTCLGLQACGNTPSLIAKAKDNHAHLLFADEFHLGGTEASVEVIDEIIIRSDIISLSLCLDVFAAPFAPGVSAPQPLGLLPWHLIPALRRLAISKKVVTFGIAELCPPHDDRHVTARLAASLIADFLAHVNS